MQQAAGSSDGDGLVLFDPAGSPVAMRPTVARLFGALLGDAGAVVPVADVVRRTWGDSPPADVSASLHTNVARLRRLLPDGAVRREGDGYVLDLPPGWSATPPRQPLFVPAIESGDELVGRDALLDDVRALLAAGTGVVLYGDSGCGKSRLVDRLVGDLAAARRDAVVLRGRSVGPDVPLGVFAPVLRDLGERQGLPVLLAARRTLLDQLTGAVLVLGIDDLHHIDPLSAVLTSQLVRGGQALLVGTHGSAAYVHPAIGDLWHEGLVAHVHVPDLDEIGVARGAARDEAIAERLAALSPEVRDTLVAVALAEPVRLEVIERAVETRPLVELERGGFVEVEQAGRVQVLRVSHPRYAELVLEGASRLLLRSLRAQLADVLADTGAANAGELLRMARWSLDGGRAMDEATAEHAARHALRHDDPELAQRIAEWSWREHRSIATAMLLAEARFVDRPGEEVIAAVEEALALADDAQRPALVVLAARAAALKLGDTPRALELLEPLGEAGTVMRAQVLAYAGRGPEALDVLDSTGVPARRARLAYLSTKAQAITQIGDGEGALALLDDALSGVEGGEDPRGRLTAQRLVAGKGRPLLVLGRLDEAEEVLRAGLEATAGAADPTAAAMNEIGLGGLLAFMGRPREGHAIAASAARRLERCGHRAPLKWALMSEGYAAAVAGDVTAADDVLRRVHALEFPTCSDGVEALVEGAVLALRFRRDEAIAALSEGADVCAARKIVFEATCAWHDIARLGGAVDPRLGEMAREVGGFVATFAIHADGIAAADADLLTDAGERFRTHGALALAAEAYGRAAEAAAAGGSMRSARNLAAESLDLAGRCEPGVARRPLIGPEPLTTREREVAEMAVAGWPNAQIGDTLGISARTVENHLSRVFAKLGVQGRSDLLPLLTVADRPAGTVE